MSYGDNYPREGAVCWIGRQVGGSGSEREVELFIFEEDAIRWKQSASAPIGAQRHVWEVTVRNVTVMEIVPAHLVPKPKGK